jgi:cytidylate kinase
MVRVMSRNRPIIIAIDGPAASGKSTTAREIAHRLGYTYIDSGAMYRAVTLKALRENIPVDDDKKVSKLAEAISLEFKKNSSKTIIYMDGEDVSDKIRSPQIDRNISPVAANPHIRSIMVKKQREMGRDGAVVMDGRDIGTVVFPAAELKIFMEASVEERAQRRLKELEQKGIEMDFNKVAADIEYRDQQDKSRNFGPLKKANDAVKIDTTRLSVEEQIDIITELARRVIDC